MDFNTVYFVGIKGVAMSGLAVLSRKLGKKVSGSDVDKLFITDTLLKKHNIHYFSGFSPQHIKEVNPDLVVFTGANGGINNIEVKFAISHNIVTVHQAEYISYLESNFKHRIAVSGCHGKTTTSSLLAYCLLKLNAKVGYLTGSPKFNNFPGADIVGKEFWVVEADEYAISPPLDLRPKFSFLNPETSVILNLDRDHPDVYKSFSDVKKAYLSFINNTTKNIVFWRDDKNLNQLVTGAPIKSKISYGLDPSSDFRVSNVKHLSEGMEFDVNKQKFKISLSGVKNVLNATAVISVLRHYGFRYEDIKNAILGFKGAKRRFEKVYANNDLFLYDDYGHHPEEIKATIQAAQNKFKDFKLIVIFQPHTYSRTKEFLGDFALSLSKANTSFVMPIFASARETNVDEDKISNLSIEKKAQELGFNNVLALQNAKQLLTHLRGLINTHAKIVIITMGAGDVYTLHTKIIKLIKQNA